MLTKIPFFNEINEKDDVCILAYHIDTTIPNNNKLNVNQINIINETSRFFTKIVCVHDCINLTGSKSNNKVIYIYCPNDNEYLDFGKYYYVVTTIPTVNRLALINDSCYLTGSIDFIENENYKSYDVLGITDSMEISYHIQSYFLVFNTPEAISSVLNFFNNFHSLPKNFTKVDLIKAWEVNISTILLNKGLKLETLFKYNDIRFTRNGCRFVNISYACPEILYLNKCPLIKKFNMIKWTIYVEDRRKIL